MIFPYHIKIHYYNCCCDFLLITNIHNLEYLREINYDSDN